MTSFSELGVPKDLTQVLDRRGLTQPFPIQAATMADAIAGKDLCGRAPTGSGKTLAFAIPTVMRAAKGAPHRPTALILLPTRELASQVADELRPLADARGMSLATFYGGTKIARDQRRLKSGVDIAVACPGRLADLVQRRDVDLRDVKLVVLDEADRMADMGFLPEVKRLLDATSDDRQTLLFSATLDGDVDVLIRRYQNNPVRHELAGSADDTGDVRHFFWHAESKDRVGLTSDIVQTVSPAIVFTRTKHAADRLTKQLSKRGVGAAAIHGNRSQHQRERALSDFISGKVSALVATDIAARGIHVDNVGAVVHYDPPATDKDYVHRSGRTGRAGADGVVVTLVLPDKVRDVKGLQRALSMRQHVEQKTLSHLHADGEAGAEMVVPAATSPSGAKPSGGSGQRSKKPRQNGSERGSSQRPKHQPNRNNRGNGRHKPARSGSRG